MEKSLTNEQILRKLLKELDSLEIALLRERIEKICDLTLAELEDEKKRKTYNTFFTTANQWTTLMLKVKDIVTLEKKEEKKEG
jgi:hypothetical protein